MKSIKSMFEEIENTVVEDTNATVKEVLPFMSSKVEEELDYAAKYHELENKLGCPLEILYEIKESKQIYIDTYIVQRPSGANMTIINRMYNVIGIDILNNQIQCLAQFSDGYMEFYVQIYDYKKTWFLKKDKSE